MNSEPRRIDYETLANNLASVLERVVREQEAVVVQTAGGELALLRYLAPADSPLPHVPDLEAFAAAAGAWADVDIVNHSWFRGLRARAACELPGQRKCAMVPEKVNL